MWTSPLSVRLVDLSEMRGSLRRRVQREGHGIVAEGQWCVHLILRVYVIVLRTVDFEWDWG